VGIASREAAIIRNGVCSLETPQIGGTTHKSSAIIAMTASPSADVQKQCLGAGMNEFLPKPFNPGDLREAVQRYLEM
jgi:CheY-like chemotaxis protein